MGTHSSRPSWRSPSMAGAGWVGRNIWMHALLLLVSGCHSSSASIWVHSVDSPPHIHPSVTCSKGQQTSLDPGNLPSNANTYRTLLLDSKPLLSTAADHCNDLDHPLIPLHHRQRAAKRHLLKHSRLPSKRARTTASLAERACRRIRPPPAYTRVARR